MMQKDLRWNSVDNKLKVDTSLDMLQEKEIPLKLRMFSICDAYEAMTVDRPYREVLSKQEVVERAGIQFDAELVDEFITLCL